MEHASTEPARITNPDRITPDGIYVILQPDKAPGLGGVHAFMPAVSGTDLAAALAPPMTILEHVLAIIDALLHPFSGSDRDALTDAVRRRAVEVGVRPYEPRGHDASMYESCRLAHNAAHAADTLPRWLVVGLQTTMVVVLATLIALAVTALHAAFGAAPLLWAGGYMAVCILAFGVLPRVLGRDTRPA